MTGKDKQAYICLLKERDLEELYSIMPIDKQLLPLFPYNALSLVVSDETFFFAFLIRNDNKNLRNIAQILVYSKQMKVKRKQNKIH